MSDDCLAHWERVHTSKAEAEVGWFQARPAASLELIARAAPGLDAGIIDVGGGASRLVDHLLQAGYQNLTVLDLAAPALERVRARLGERAGGVALVVADATAWRPERTYEVWHDGAAFHFLGTPALRAAYLAALTAALRPGGQAIIGTFAADGPERCSGLPVTRYDEAGLAAALGDGFRLVDTLRDLHVTPGGVTQPFLFGRFLRLAAG